MKSVKAPFDAASHGRAWPIIQAMENGFNERRFSNRQNTELLRYHIDTAISVSASYLEHREAEAKEQNLLLMDDIHFFRCGQMLFDRLVAPREANNKPHLPSVKIVSPLAGHWPLITDEIMRAARDLPPGVAALTASGMETEVGRRLTDFDPEGAKHLANGYRNKLTMEYAPAYYIGGKIVMLEEHRSEAVGHQYVISKDPYFYYLHECGHKLDFDRYGFRGISDHEPFVSAYAHDVERLKDMPAGPIKIGKVARLYMLADEMPAIGFYEKADDTVSTGRRYNQDYYLSQREQGMHYLPECARHEAFAELFGSKIAGYERYGTLRATFRESAAALDTIVASVECEMGNAIDLEALLGPDYRTNTVRSYTRYDSYDPTEPQWA